ncbi:hypothetical protein M378DRAFT_350579 [Amanita muscaria Koide BX008]|uniref:Uncharacterized protein n=1 Tax=Amanita muscaria (strain Koide BX008) TaxID=946122 RepID=A0A0C2XDC2_AMAMK|nr:hypothetical protein M378DRAFT_350579 [Amanita muscaria Koide BX008]
MVSSCQSDPVDSFFPVRYLTNAIHSCCPMIVSFPLWVCGMGCPALRSSIVFNFNNAQATRFDGTTVNGAGADLYDAGGAASVSADVYGDISVSLLKWQEVSDKSQS